MTTATLKKFTTAALFVATGLAPVGVANNLAKAELMPLDGALGYAGARIQAALTLVATMPPIVPVAIPMADKGDLRPIGCAGPFRADKAAECLDTAYELASEDTSMVVETRVGDSTSVLVRTTGYAMADIEDPMLGSE